MFKEKQSLKLFSSFGNTKQLFPLYSKRSSNKKEDTTEQKQFLEQIQRFVLNTSRDAFNSYNLQSPSLEKVREICEIWSLRPDPLIQLTLLINDDEQRSSAYLSACLQTPSISLTLNGKQVNCANKIREQGFLTFEGTEERMSVWCRQTSSLYRGPVKNSKYSGLGLLYYNIADPKGYFYQGQFCDGMMQGEGILSTNDLIIYEGTFSKGFKNGFGKQCRYVFNESNQSFTPQYQYVGQFKNNEKEGKGTLIDKIGEYKGEFVNGKKQGNGEMRYNDNNFYEGSWKQGQIHGYGTYLGYKTYKYVGEFQMGVKSGQGQIIYQSGEIYTGVWKLDKQHGQGRCEWRTKKGKLKGYYEGSWVEGQPKGWGEYQLCDQEYYQGEIEGFTRCGKGTLVNLKDQSVIQAIWKDNQIVQQVKDQPHTL